MKQYICRLCNATENLIKDRNICKNCNNERRRNKYKENEEHRLRLIKMASEFKYNKRKKAREEKKKAEVLEIGFGNKKCNYCELIKNEKCFRTNRKKCRDCERDDPNNKFQRYIRTRIYNALHRNKTKNTIEYLGCANIEYLDWLQFCEPDFTLDNYGWKYHIDHVIPISTFDMKNPEHIMLAFNWRNTMPLLGSDNLAKNKKIITNQLQQHIIKLEKYHTKNNIIFPNIFKNKFATLLDAGNPLEP